MSITSWLFAIFCCMTMQSCATIFSGNLDETKLIANSNRLELRDAVGAAFKVGQVTDGEWTHYSFELDKHEPHHDILVRSDSLSYFVRFDRKVNHWWWFTNLITYELGSLIDFGTDAIYHFPHHRIDVGGSSIPPIVSKLDTLEQLEHDLLISGFFGFVFPVYQDPLTFTSWGTSLAAQVRKQFWIGAGYTGSTYIESILGPQEKIYSTSGHIAELYLQYYPIWGLFASVGLGREWLTFERTNGKKEDPLTFSNSLYTIGFGIGLNTHGFLIEWRKYLGLSRIDTPLEEGRSIKLDQFRIGFGVGFNSP